MKIKPEHYQAIKDRIAPHIPKLKAHREYLLSDKCKHKPKDLEKRIRWDFWWIAKIPYEIASEIYEYANDEHVDTALKKIMKELTMGQEKA